MENSVENGSWNSTLFNFTLDNADVETPILKKVHDGIIFVLLIVVMFSMGCLITPKEIWEHLRLPIGVLIGLISQFVVLPLCAFCLIKILQVPTMQATGMLILASCPGGVTSNVFTYFVDGSVALSVTMTTMSTLLAMGMMPLNLWMYAGHLTGSDGGVIVPYGKIGISLILVTVPVILGMFFKWKVPKPALFISKSGSIFGLVLIVLILVLEIILYPDIFNIIAWQLYICLAVLPSLSLSLGYGLAWILRQPVPVRKTVGIECSVQNVGVSITIITMSFPFKIQKDVIAFSYIFPVPCLTTMGIIIAAYQLWKRKYSKNHNKAVNEEMLNDATEFSSDPKSKEGLLSTSEDLKKENKNGSLEVVKI